MDINCERMSPAQWQQAIEESWLLCENDELAATIQLLLDQAHYIYFSMCRSGVAHQALLQHPIIQVDLPSFDLMCFYQELNHKPKIEPCMLYVDAFKNHQLAWWMNGIAALNQEAFVCGMEGNHYLYHWQDDSFRSQTIIKPQALSVAQWTQRIDQTNA